MEPKVTCYNTECRHNSGPPSPYSFPEGTYLETHEYECYLKEIRISEQKECMLFSLAAISF